MQPRRTADAVSVHVLLSGLGLLWPGLGSCMRGHPRAWAQKGLMLSVTILKPLVVLSLHVCFVNEV